MEQGEKKRTFCETQYFIDCKDGKTATSVLHASGPGTRRTRCTIATNGRAAIVMDIDFRGHLAGRAQVKPRRIDGEHRPVAQRKEGTCAARPTGRRAEVTGHEADS